MIHIFSKFNISLAWQLLGFKGLSLIEENEFFINAANATETVGGNMKFLFSVITAFLTVCFLSGNVFSDTIILDGIEEAYVFDDDPGTTHNDTSLRFLEYSDGRSQWSFIKFDLSTIPENAEIS